MLIPLKQPQSSLRAAITAAYRRPEADAISPLIDAAHLTAEQSVAARTLASGLVKALRTKCMGGGIFDQSKHTRD